MNNSFFKFNEFKNKKILILVPHQDDEINLCGGMLASFKKINCEVHVVYSTNGDYFVKDYFRHKEAIKVLKYFNVKKENIHFLGYCDQLKDQKNHIYLTNELWHNVRNINETYTYNNQDYHYLKSGYHNQFYKENFLHDIKDIILDIMPDFIFAIDIDYHPDHRALSLSFEKVMGEILKENENYKPFVFKGFAYSTSYNGYNDLFNSYNVSTKINKEKFSIKTISNMYYDYNDRCRFPVLEIVYTNNLFKNKIYKTLKYHASQVLVRKTKSIINNDNIYWRRRTNNLLNVADVKVSSGDQKYLNDFMFFDLDDVMNGDKEYLKISKKFWHPNDEDKKIIIKFDKPKNIYEFNFYQQSYDLNSKIKKVELTIDKNKYIIDLENMVTNYCLEKAIKTSKIEIKLLEVEGYNYGFSELEIFSPEDNKINFIKLIKNDDFIYKELNNLNNCSFYGMTTNFKSVNLTISEVKIISSKNIEINNKIIKLKNNLKKGYITFCLKNNVNVFDTIEILPSYYKLFKLISKNISKLYLKIGIFNARVKHKILKVVFKMYW